MAEEQDKEAELLAEVERLSAEVRGLRERRRRPQPEILDGVVTKVEAQEKPEPKAEDNGDVVVATTAAQPTAEPADADLLRDRVANVSASLADAYRGGRFMVVVWRLNNQNQLVTDRHQHGFDPELFDDAIRELRRNMEQVAGPPAVKALPRAAVSRPKPIDVMFGVQKKQEDKEPEAEEEEGDEY